MTGGHPGLSRIMWNRNKKRRALKNSCSVYPWWDLARSQWKTRQWRGDKIYWLYFYCLWAPRLLALIRDLLHAHITSFLLAWLLPGFFYTFNFMHFLKKIERKTCHLWRKFRLSLRSVWSKTSWGWLDEMWMSTSRVRAISMTSVFCFGRRLKVIRRLSSPSCFTKPPAFT